jgi:hypothetical protein
MVINDKFKYFGKMIKNRNRSVITNNGTFAFFKHSDDSSFFHNDGYVTLVSRGGDIMEPCGQYGTPVSCLCMLLKSGENYHNI